MSIMSEERAFVAVKNCIPYMDIIEFDPRREGEMN